MIGRCPMLMEPSHLSSVVSEITSSLLEKNFEILESERCQQIQSQVEA